MRILFASPEVAPFSKTGGLGDVAWGLPRALARRGHDVVVMTPLYGCIDRGRFGLENTGRRLPGGGELWQWTGEPGLRVVFIGSEGLFARSGVYGEGGVDYPDNARRFAFFSRALQPAAEALGFGPVEILHLNDWQTGLAAAELFHRRIRAGNGSRTKSVFTIHNLAYQGNFDPEVVEALDVAAADFSQESGEFWGSFSFLKLGLARADWLTTVSPTYAGEIQRSEQGCGLDGFLRGRTERLLGIVNGIDTEEWDPSADPMLAAFFNADRMEGKRICHADLCRSLGIAQGPGLLVLGMVSRFVEQKGFELVLEALPRLMERNLALAILGTGEARYEEALREAAARYPGRIGLRIGFDEELAHRLIAGSDAFLMPSLYEPCGLAQMYALRYGSPPIVRATGGLADTVVEVTGNAGTGFRFDAFTGDAMVEAIDRALDVFASKERWHALMRRGMETDFSWDASAKRYEDIYRRALES